MKKTVEEILSLTRGKFLQGERCASVKGVSIDSRTIQRGQLFIAIAGENFDGHAFARKAVRKGAGAVIVSKRIMGIKSSVPVIRVKDTVVALGRIAQAHRQQQKAKVIAVTGSTGKTTTKEMIAAVLKSRYRLLKNNLSENNHIGVPLTLLKLNPSHAIAVIELGTNQPGDIRYLAKIARPDIAVYTNIGESHLERLKTPERVFHEKAQLAKHLNSQGTLIVNHDDPYLRRLKKCSAKKNVITYGIKSKAQYHARNVTLSCNTNINFVLNRKKKFILPTPAVHNVSNALAAISCGRLFKIRYNDIEKILLKMSAPKGRMAITKYHRCWILNDTYNANPTSFKAALKALEALQLSAGCRRIVVCSNMGELGKGSERLHCSIGVFAANTKVDAVFSLGKYARLISKTAQQKDSSMTAKHFASMKDLNTYLRMFMRPGDAVLVKASRKERMERTVEFLYSHL